MNLEASNRMASFSHLRSLDVGLCNSTMMLSETQTLSLYAFCHSRMLWPHDLKTATHRQAFHPHSIQKEGRN